MCNGNGFARYKSVLALGRHKSEAHHRAARRSLHSGLRSLPAWSPEQFKPSAGRGMISLPQGHEANDHWYEVLLV